MWVLTVPSVTDLCISQPVDLSPVVPLCVPDSVFATACGSLSCNDFRGIVLHLQQQPEPTDCLFEISNTIKQFTLNINSPEQLVELPCECCNRLTFKKSKLTVHMSCGVPCFICLPCGYHKCRPVESFMRRPKEMFLPIFVLTGLELHAEFLPKELQSIEKLL